MDALETDIEIIGLPKKGNFKVVQVMVKGRPVMVCGSKYHYHSRILADYLNSQGLPFDKCEDVEGPVVEGREYLLVGAGESRIDESSGKMVIPYDFSTGYCIGPNERFTERLQKQLNL